MSRMPSVKDVRKHLSHVDDELLNLRIFRFFTPHVVRVLVAWNVNPNVLSFSWILLGILGAVLTAGGRYGFALAGVVLVQVAQYIDQLDGPVARFQGKAHPVGQYLDKAGSVTQRALLLAGMALGGYRVYDSPIYLYCAVLLPLFVFGGAFLRQFPLSLMYAYKVKKNVAGVSEVLYQRGKNRVKEYVLEFVRPTNPMNVTLFAALLGFFYLLAVPYTLVMGVYFFYQFIRSYQVVKQF